MTTRTAVLMGTDGDSMPPVVELPANDNIAGLPRLRIGADYGAEVGIAPANDDWIEEDLPISIGVLAEEVAILDGFLRAEILALFD